MNIVTLEQCDSTNTEMRQMISRHPELPHGTALRTISQTKGRGQRGNTWESLPGKNITLSILLKPRNIGPHSHFLVSEAIALGTVNFLQRFLPQFEHSIRIKWPNDIHVEEQKIAGILMENTLRSDGSLMYCIAGIGLNVNQTSFSSQVPNAVSMAMLTRSSFDVDYLAHELVSEIMTMVNALDTEGITESHPIERDYHKYLWRQPGCSFKWKEPISGYLFQATIQKVLPTGQLVLLTSENTTRSYFFKEIIPA